VIIYVSNIYFNDLTVHINFSLHLNIYQVTSASINSFKTGHVLPSLGYVLTLR